VIALARGVGPHNAARIINKLREDEDEFYRDVLRQEREYARTQSFWDYACRRSIRSQSGDDAIVYL